MKKIIGLTIAAMLVMVSVAGGTWAYFSDTETSPNNVLTAGTLDLKYDGADVAVATISANNTALYPGSHDESAYKLIKNAGTLTGKLSIKVTGVANTNVTDMTGIIDGGNGTAELGANAKFAMWIDVNKTGIFASGDYILKSTGAVAYDAGTHPAIVDGDYETVDTLNAKYWNFVKTMGANDEYRFYIYWKIPSTAGSAIQGDRVSADLEFTLSQNEDATNPYV